MGQQKNSEKPVKKQVALTVPAEVAYRMMFLRKAGIGDALTDAVLPHLLSAIAELEKKNRIPQDAWKQQRFCSACGSMMVIRTSSKKDVPTKFWGCLEFPSCKQTESV